MSEQQPTEPEKLFGIGPEKPTETDRGHLLGSTAADICVAIVATTIWWAVGAVVAFNNARLAGPIGGLMFCLFACQVLAVGFFAKGSGVFIITQILTAILLPVLAVGLFFGACMVMAR